MTATVALERPGTENQSIYNRVFWMSYVANALAVAANGLTFRFAEFVAFLGGSEQVSGNIVSIGVMVAVLARFGLGQAIDRYGTRHLWLVSTLIFLSSFGMFLISHDLSWTIYAGRVLFSVGLAGMFSCSMVHIQNQVPSHRRTEVIASLGSSGFVGMVAGPKIADLIFQWVPEGEMRFYMLFAGAALLVCIYFCLIIGLTQGDTHSRPHETPSAFRLMVRYWPGPIVLVAMMMGINFTVISVFLTRFVTHLGLPGIGTFFMGYAAAAFTFRLGTRNWGNRVGRHRMALIGLCGVGCGNLMFPFVTADWHLLFPAIVCGFGHALLFPAVVSLGAGAFPPHYRGSGTTVVLGFTEIGTILSAPILGAIIDFFGQGFSQMFVTTGCTSFVIAAAYALTAARQPDYEVQPLPSETRRDPQVAVTVPTSPQTALVMTESIGPTVSKSA